MGGGGGGNAAAEPVYTGPSAGAPPGGCRRWHNSGRGNLRALKGCNVRRVRSPYGRPRASLVGNLLDPLGTASGLLLAASVLSAANMLSKPWTTQTRVVESPRPKRFLDCRGKILKGHFRL